MVVTVIIQIITCGIMIVILIIIIICDIMVVIFLKSENNNENGRIMRK